VRSFAKIKHYPERKQTDVKDFQFVAQSTKKKILFIIINKLEVSARKTEKVYPAVAEYTFQKEKSKIFR
jgi:hypothetical protein